jgi:hypothetical protein
MFSVAGRILLTSFMIRCFLQEELATSEDFDHPPLAFEPLVKSFSGLHLFFLHRSLHSTSPVSAKLGKVQLPLWRMQERLKTQLGQAFMNLTQGQL